MFTDKSAKIQVEFENGLCSPNNSDRTFIQRKALIFSRVRNFDPIIGELVGS